MPSSGGSRPTGPLASVARPAKQKKSSARRGRSSVQLRTQNHTAAATSAVSSMSIWPMRPCQRILAQVAKAAAAIQAARRLNSRSPRRETRSSAATALATAGSRAATSSTRPRTSAAADDRPELERRLVGVDLAVQVRHQVLAAGAHLARHLGVARLVGVPQIAAADAGQEEERAGERQEEVVAPADRQAGEEAQAAAPRRWRISHRLRP